MNSMLKFKQSLSVRKFPRGSQRFPENTQRLTEMKPFIPVAKKAIESGIGE